MRDSYRIANNLINSAVQKGWRVRNGGGRTILYPTNIEEPPINVHLTISDYRGVRNLLALARRRGLDVDPMGELRR